MLVVCTYFGLIINKFSLIIKLLDFQHRLLQDRLN